MTTAMLRYELTLPRALLEAWPACARPADFEAYLRERGLLPVAAQTLTWRIDPVNAGYVLAYQVPLTLTEPVQL
jgi:hypothetical protein